jgi:hypothetical protein
MQYTSPGVPNFVFSRYRRKYAASLVGVWLPVPPSTYQSFAISTGGKNTGIDAEASNARRSSLSSVIFVKCPRRLAPIGWEARKRRAPSGIDKEYTLVVARSVLHRPTPAVCLWGCSRVISLRSLAQPPRAFQVTTWLSATSMASTRCTVPGKRTWRRAAVRSDYKRPSGNSGVRTPANASSARCNVFASWVAMRLVRSS